MYIRKTTKKVKGKTYVNYLLVESHQTPKGPRQKTICSLGSLAPRRRSEWLHLVRNIEDALCGQGRLDGSDDEAAAIAQRIITSRTGGKSDTTHDRRDDDDVVAVHTDRVTIERAREAGPVHLGHQFFERLGMGGVLNACGLTQRSCLLTEVMVLNRLIFPASEHAMPDWIQHTALSDILKTDLESLSYAPLYRNLDKLHPHRVEIESALAKREKTLFNLDDTYYLYDLTSTYFEGECPFNPQAKRGYSRDKRPDCKQVVVGLVLDRDGFPKAHEVFDGNRQDRTTVDEMLDGLEKRTGRSSGATVIVDRGMAYEDNLEQIRKRHHHYIVAARQKERIEWLAEFEEEDGFEDVIREPSPCNPFQKKSRLQVKRKEKGDELHILCLSEERKEKDRAIREKHEARLLRDLDKLQARITAGRLKKIEKIYIAIGRLKERYPRVARYYPISYDADNKELTWSEDSERKEIAAKVDGAYLLKTDRKDLTAEEAWRLYILLTRVENAFRNMKSPLAERPIFHHLEHRVQTHIFLCVLAYHLLVSIEHTLLQKGIHTSWATVREALSTHQVVTVVLPATDGRILRLRKATAPEPQHLEIYRALDVSPNVMTAVRTWTDEGESET